MKKHLLKKWGLILTGAILIFVVAFASGSFTSVAKQALAQSESLQNIENPIARILLQKFFPNPNLLVEDNVKISCEPEFSVKVFTASTLVNTNFTVKDAKTGAALFGPKLIDKIEPLWQKVWLGPLSSIPSKIHVVMDAKTPDGKSVSHQLIVEPDCSKPGSIITKKIVILWPKGKLLINPVPPFTPPSKLPQEPPLTPRFFDIPFTVAVPQEAIGQDLIAAVLWKNPETGVRQYLSAYHLPDIPTQIVPFSLPNVWPQALAGGPYMTELDPPQSSIPSVQSAVLPASFFDVFVELVVIEPNEEIGRLIIDVMEKVGKGEVVTVEEPLGQRLLSTFEEAYMGFGDYVKTPIWGIAVMDAEPLRVIDATPLESRCPLDNDCDGTFNSSDNCSATPNPNQVDTDMDGIGDACDPCPTDSTNTCSAATVTPPADTTNGATNTDSGAIR